MADYPEVNGNEPAYCSIELDIDGTKLRGVKSINYKDAGEIPKIKGTAVKAIGRTRGNFDHEGDIEMYAKEWDDLLPKLTQNGAVGYSELAWNVAVTYSEPLERSRTKTDRLIGVRFHSAERSNQEGVDALTVKLTMSIMDIAWHGKYYSALG